MNKKREPKGSLFLIGYKKETAFAVSSLKIFSFTAKATLYRGP